MMRFYIDSISHNQALNYAVLSADFTHNHKGWEDEYSKHKRIIGGQIAQNYFFNWLLINGIQVEKDSSNYMENDFFDLKINGCIYDVKSSMSNIPMMITRTYENKKVDFFVFFKVGFDVQWWIEPVGYIDYKSAIQPAYFVPHNQYLGNTTFRNKFKEGAYCYTGLYYKVSRLFSLVPKQINQ